MSGLQAARGRKNSAQILLTRFAGRAKLQSEEKANNMSNDPTESIKIGIAGWSYSDWEGIVYPRPAPHGFHALEYMSQFFDVVEVNSSFYQPPRAENTRLWARQVEANPRFHFTAKLWRGFTHERNATRQDEKVFKAGLAPLASAGRLGALLLQFPWSWKYNRQNREYLGALVVQFMEYPLVIEVRHSSWNKPEVFRLLEDLGAGICNIDQPVIGRSIAPGSKSTSGVGYVRLHGRNYEHWFAENQRPEERYNYLYTTAELEPWLERILAIAAKTRVTYVVTNNHYGGKGVVNSLQLIHMLRHQPVAMPEGLSNHFPVLRPIEKTASAAAQPWQQSLMFSAELRAV
jgi:uncharacterized protein YecE (DUF72 family)